MEEVKESLKEISYIKKYERSLERIGYEIYKATINCFKHGLFILNRKYYIVPEFDNSLYTEEVLIRQAAIFAEIFYSKGVNISKETKVFLKDLDLRIVLSKEDLFNYSKRTYTPLEKVFLGLEILQNSGAIGIYRKDKTTLSIKADFEILHKLKEEGYKLCENHILDNMYTESKIRVENDIIFDWKRLYIEMVEEGKDISTLFN